MSKPFFFLRFNRKNKGPSGNELIPDGFSIIYGLLKKVIRHRKNLDFLTTRTV